MKLNKLTASMLSLSVVTTTVAGSTPILAVSQSEPAAAQSAQRSAFDLTPYGDNLALNKSAQASSSEASSLGPANAFDGDTTSASSRWSTKTGSGPDWISVDLGSVQTVGLIRLFWESTKADNFQIQYRADESEDWQTAYDNEGYPETLENNIELDSPVQARYVRLYIPSFSSSEHVSTGVVDWPTVSIYEMEVYEPADPNRQDLNANVALHKTAVASSIEANSVRAELAVDGDTTSRTSRWGSAVRSDPEWIYVDLGETLKVKTVKLFWENRKATAYAIQTAPDGADLNSEEAWTDQKVYNDRPQTINEQIVLDETVEARYVRLYIPSHTAEDPDGGVTWNTVSIYEMEVYGGVPKTIATLDDALEAIVVTAPEKGDTTLQVSMPVVDGIDVIFDGADLEQVVDENLNIHTPVVDKEVKLAFKATKAEDNSYKFKEITVTIPGQYTVEEQDNVAPVILPELQEWKGLEGEWSVQATTRVLYTDDTLQVAAQDMAADYAEIGTAALECVKGNVEDAQPGDIVFVLDENADCGEEGYRLNIDDVITVLASHETGGYYAGRTLLQALQADDDHVSINKGIARDYPLYEIRGLILDVGRKTFSMDFLKKLVKLMSWYKLNDFQVHLNDNYIFLEGYTNSGRDPMEAYSGFRLESDIKAGGNGGLNQADLTSTDMFYTKDEFRDFIKESRVMGVNIVPEFDTPAHSLALTKVRPDLRHGTSGRENDHLNLLTKYDESLEFVQSIFDEYLLGEDPVFDEETVIHIGADEYTSSSAAYRNFVNDMFDYVESTGRKARVWGSLSTLATGAYVDGTGREINLWNNGYAEIGAMYKLGFDLINCNDGLFYIVPNASYYYDYLSDSTVYNNNINTIGGVTIPSGDLQMKGGAFAVWNDMIDDNNNGMSEYDIYDRIVTSAGLYAANVWGKGDASVTEAKARTRQLNNVPGADFSYAVESLTDTIVQITMDTLDDLSGNGYDLTNLNNASLETVDYKQALKLNGGSSYANVEGLSTVGLDNDLRVKVKRTSASNEEQVLFESEYGAIKAVMADTGKVGITRENCDYSFDYELPVGQWVELEFKNEFEMISLYVNGELIGTVGSHTRNQEKATVMFPIGTIGSQENAFIGYVDDLRLGAQDTFNSTMRLDEKVLLASSLADQADLDDVINQAKEVINTYAPAQEDIDAALAALDAALADVEYEKANYATVEAYLALVPEDLSLFTDASVQTLQRAIDNITYNLPLAMQDAVDGMAQSLASALKALEVNTDRDATLVDQSIMTATASSYQVASEPGYPEYAIDGDPTTMWHTDWNITTMPHWLSIEFDTEQTIDAVLYSPRSNGGNGTATSYDIAVSSDGTTWEVIKSGTLAANAQTKTIELDSPVTTKFVRMIWKTATNNNGSCSEINFRLADLTPDLEGLNALIDAATALNSENYTEESWQALQDVLEQAVELAASESADPNEVNAMKGALAKAMAALDPVAVETPVDPTPVDSDKTLLQWAVDYALLLNTDGVNPLVVQRFNTALAQAQAVLANEAATQAEVDAAWAELTQAIHMMGFTTDKSELAALVSQAQALDLDEYKDGESKDDFLAALENALAVLEDPAALDDVSIRPAIDALKEAMAALEKKDVTIIDTTLLQMLYDAVVDQEQQLDRYVQDGQSEFVAALRQAEAVLADPESDEQVSNAITDLHNAWLNLRLKADESLLENLQKFLDTVDALDSSLYSTEEFAQIQSVYDEVSAALKAHANGSAQLDAATGEVLSEKVAGLAELLNRAPASLDDSISQSQGTSQAVQTAGTKTATAMHSLGWMSAVAAAGAAALALLKRRSRK